MIITFTSCTCTHRPAIGIVDSEMHPLKVRGKEPPFSYEKVYDMILREGEQSPIY